MSESSKVDICPSCGAERWQDSGKCWLCGGLRDNPYAIQPNAVRAADQVRQSATERWDRIVAYLLIGLVVLVGVGIAIDEPWALTGYAFLLIPGVLGATRARQRQKRQGKTGFFGSRTAAILRGGVTIVVTYILLVGALLILLFTICAVGGSGSMH
jgi:hypothetical protein